MKFNEKTKESFISLSQELIHMTMVEREEFLRDTPDFPNSEKLFVIETFIAMLEKQEDYETCAGLYRLKQELHNTSVAA